jgi:hypothetical protein
MRIGKKALTAIPGSAAPSLGDRKGRGKPGMTAPVSIDRRIIFAGGKVIDILVVPDRVVIALGWSVIRRAV